MGTGDTITEVKWEYTGVKGPVDPPTGSSKIDHINSTWLPDTLQFFSPWFPAVRTILIFPKPLKPRMSILPGPHSLVLFWQALMTMEFPGTCIKMKILGDLRLWSSRLAVALGCEFQQAPNTGGFEGWRLQTRLSETTGSQTSVCFSLLGGKGRGRGPC